MRCAYCNKECYGQFCSEGCQNEYKRFEEYAKRHEIHFIILLFGSMLFMVPMFAFIDHAITFLGLMLISMGATMTAFPFCTPETNRMWGVRKSVKVARILGIAMILGGMIMVAYDLI